MKLLFDNGNQHISGNSAPDLRLHRILAVADETLYAQVLLDPFEEQFHLPATLVERSNRQRRKDVLLVRKTNVLPVPGSLKRMRRNCSG